MSILRLAAVLLALIFLLILLEVFGGDPWPWFAGSWLAFVLEPAWPATFAVPARREAP